MPRPHLLLIPLLAAPLAILALSRGPAGDFTPATPAAFDLDHRPAKGPELERWYFGRWYAPEPPELSADFLDRAWTELRAMPSEDTAGRAVNAWQLEGPLTMQQSTGARWTGRVLDIDLTTGTPRIASASGGLWTHEFLFPVAMSDDLTSLAIGSVDTDPTDPDHILVGTGEYGVRFGTGIWESRDGGLSWTRVHAAKIYTVRLRFDPHDPDRVFAAGASLHRSTDGGATWQLSAAGVFTDLAFDPVTPNVIYTYEIGQGPQKSTNGGTSWSNLGALPGSPTLGRGAIAVAPTTPNYVYCSVANNDTVNKQYGLEGLYLSTNGGSTWLDRTPSTNYMGNQGWYDNVLAVHPLSPTIVLAAGVQLMYSNNAGFSWSQVSDPDLHVDYHAIEWRDDASRVYVGNDGGYMYSSDGAQTWSSTVNILPVTQFYHFDTAEDDGTVIVGGTQDNGFARTSNGGSTWDRPFGGDGGCVVVDPFDSTRWWVTNGVYSGNWAFQRLRTTDSGATWATQNSGIAASDQWAPEIRDDGVNPVWLYTTSGGWVYRSTSAGTSWTSLTASNFGVNIASLTVPDYSTSLGSIVYACLDANLDGTRLRVYKDNAWAERGWGFDNSVRKVAKVPGSNAYRAYALINGTNSAPKVWRTDNGGNAWDDITGNLPDWIPVADVVQHPLDSSQLFLGTSFGCFRSNNGGELWERWNNGLPEATIVTEMLGVDSLSTNGKFYVYIATYGRGVWSREIAGEDPVDVAELPDSRPDVVLEAPRPNPARGRTSIAYTLPKAAEVDLSVYDVAGRKVATLASGPVEAGRHSVDLAGEALAAGVYWARLVAPGVEKTQKIVLVR
ncbi:MAG: T9SS type A sorting domain-containing protein [Gemmatimonadetes bacterium]|nr:T9SS type A sorting domain-containing protein [Gemmatimonadota bacterium]